MVALAQAVLADLGEGDVHVVRARQVAGGPDERVVVEDVQDARDGDQDVVLGDLRLVAEGVLAAATATTVAVTATASTPAALEVVVGLVGTRALLTTLLAALAALTALTLLALAALLVVALAATVALTVTALAAAVAAALTTLATLAPVLAVAPALGGVGGGLCLGIRLSVRLDVDGRLGPGLCLGLGLGVRAARLGGGPTTAALTGRLVVAGRLTGNVDLLLRDGLLGLVRLLGSGRGLVARARLGGGAPLRLGLGLAGARLGALRRGRAPARLRLLDDLDQLALAHPRSAPDPEAGRDLLQLGQDHALEAGAGAAAP